ncbi:hypothetical protein [Dongia sedimenti]|uniref:Lipoprotein n=1 Tax=Dongia sedimenti TaxID=3064282 RepID=A0ABU0YNZ8_9PROT|nr:hypothetical protein [Rhodospirillaceae bacterium R-7]
MLRVSRMVLIRVVLFTTIAALIAGCGDPVKEAKTAAQLRGQIEKALSRMEATGEVPGLEHRHVTVDPDSDVDGFAIKIYDVKLGTPEIGFQAFKAMTFSLSRSGDTHFMASDFKLTPPPVANGPKTSADALIEQLKNETATLQVSD